MLTKKWKNGERKISNSLERADGLKVPSGTVLIDNLPSYCCADIADRKGMALQNMDRAERNGALGKP